MLELESAQSELEGILTGPSNRRAAHSTVSDARDDGVDKRSQIFRWPGMLRGERIKAKAMEWSSSTTCLPKVAQGRRLTPCNSQRPRMSGWFGIPGSRRRGPAARDRLDRLVAKDSRGVFVRHYRIDRITVTPHRGPGMDRLKPSAENTPARSRRPVTTSGRQAGSRSKQERANSNSPFRCRESLCSTELVTKRAPNGPAAVGGLATTALQPEQSRK